jgi:hypothetical protein
VISSWYSLNNFEVYSPIILKSALLYMAAQYVVIPIRRSTAEVFYVLISHALGDAGSPYIVGLVKKKLFKIQSSYLMKKRPLQYFCVLRRYQTALKSH